MRYSKERGKRMKKFLLVIILAFCMCPLFGVVAQATSATEENTETSTSEDATTKDNTTEEVVPNVPQKGYYVLETDGGWQCYYNGAQQKKVYFSLKQSNGTYKVVKPGKANSYVYYFDANGNGTKYKKKRFVKVSYKKTKYTYFSNKGTILKNTIAGNKSQGYYYVDSTGVKVTTKEMKQAVKFVRSCTKTSWSKSRKLQACYNKLWKNYTYERFYDTPKASKMPSYARYMFSKKRGNCFRYAASFAYIAKVIGYDVRVVTGSISSLRGGMTPHGWTEIKIDGKWYMFDANMQRNFPTISSYKKTESTYPYRHEVSKKYKMTVKNGKVKWK